MTLTPEQHRLEAESILAKLGSYSPVSPSYVALLSKAQLHATLALGTPDPISFDAPAALSAAPITDSASAKAISEGVAAGILTDATAASLAASGNPVTIDEAAGVVVETVPAAKPKRKPTAKHAAPADDDAAPASAEAPTAGDAA